VRTTPFSRITDRESRLAAIRAPPLLGLFAASAVFALAACGESKSGSTRTGTPGAGTTATAGTTTGGGIDTLAGAGTNPVTSAAQGTATALLEQITVGRHEGYDRVVFQFENHLPGYSVGYARPPFAEDGSGAPVQVAGGAFVVVRMEPASGFDLETAEGRLVYKGPRRIEGADSGTSVVRELVRTGDFEAVLSWVVGLEERVDFRVSRLTGPPRLVVDFRNH
jgi:hypothetical protein